MQTDFLEYLLDIKETRSLSQTAENFYISHQSVRAGIKNLEQYFSVQLIQCTNKGCILTEAGELVAEYASTIFQGKSELEKNLKPFIDHTLLLKQKKSHLNIYVMSGIANGKVLNFLTEYKKTHKHIEMSIRVVKLERLVSGDYLEIDNSSVLLTNYTTMTGAKLYRHFDILEERYALGRIVLAKSPLWLVVGKKSPWSQYELITESEMSFIPIFSNDYGLKQNGSEKNMNSIIVNGFTEQAKLIKNNLGGALFNELEYQDIFQNDKSIKKIPVNINGHTTMSYIGLTNGEEGFSEELTDFLKSFCEIFN